MHHAKRSNSSDATNSREAGQAARQTNFLGEWTSDEATQSSVVALPLERTGRESSGPSMAPPTTLTP